MTGEKITCKVQYLGDYCTVVVRGAWGKVAEQQQTLYAAAGSVAEEELSSIRTVAAFGGEHKEIDR